MIAIDRIRIHGFRSIESLKMPLGKTSVLIGSNNCGKTTVLTALQLALTDELTLKRSDFHCCRDGKTVDEVIIDVRFIPVNERGERVSYFDERWIKALPNGIEKDHFAREYFAFRTHFLWNTSLERIDKTREIFTHWDKETLGSALEAPIECIKMVMLRAEDDLKASLHRSGSFINLALSQLKQELSIHPTYAQTPIEDWRELLNRLSETLEGPGSVLPEDVPLNAKNIGKFFDWVKNDRSQSSAASLQGLGCQKTVMTLSTLTLVEGLVRQAKAHDWPLFILMAAEEPETHLHPNAQRSLMKQLMNLSHQLLVSTHSPYIASVVEPQALRSMTKFADRIDVRWLPRKMSPCDVRILKRLILRFRGEVLFARGLMFVEGVTEEQLIRGMFHAYFGDDPSAFGISIVGVDGKSYAPFLLLALSLRKPFCVVSDNDGDTSHVVLKQLLEVENKVQVKHQDNQSEVFFLSHGLAIEGELMLKMKLRKEVIEALLACSNLTDPSTKTRKLRRQRYLKMSDRELKHRLEKKKSEYSAFLGEIIQENPFGRKVEEMLPMAVLSAFSLIRKWLGKDRLIRGRAR